MENTNDGTLFEPRKLKGRARRTQNVSTRLTKLEECELLAASTAEGKTLSEWARDVLLRRARGSTPLGGEEQVLLTEIVGVELFLMNVLSPLSQGGHITPEQYQNIIKTVRTSKKQAAEKIIARRLSKEQQ
jgi:hypothetical protein